MMHGMGFDLIYGERGLTIRCLSDDTVEAEYFICAACCEVFCCSIEPEATEPVKHTAGTTGEPEPVLETPPEPYTWYCPTCGNLLHKM